ncbi:MAG: PAS domain S-box protein [Piscirickettsiaceae bacterium]|nr:PAS domain S-box protein [Piscirickettsiaceae bacterium]
MLNSTKIIFFATSILMGLAGNIANLELFFGVNFLFGSIATMLVLRISGWAWGSLAGFLISLYSLYLWGHPYAIIIFTLEAVVVGFLIHSKRFDDYVLADITYWIVIGGPLIYLFYTQMLELDDQVSYLIIVKQSLNGILNTVISSLIFIGILSIRPNFSSLKILLKHESWPLHKLVRVVLMFFAIVPLIIIMTISNSSEFNKIETHLDTQINEKLIIGKKRLNQFITWHAAHGDVLVDLLADSLNDQNEIKNSFADWYLLSTPQEIEGLVIVDSQHISHVFGSNDYKNKMAELTVNELDAMLRQAPLELNFSKQDQLFYLILPRNPKGFTALVVMKDESITKFLQQLSPSTNWFSALQDSNGNVLADNSTNDMFLLKDYVHSEDTSYLHPKLESNSLLKHWKTSYRFSDVSVASNDAIRLMFATPMDEYIDLLQNTYFRTTLMTILAAIFILFVAPLASRLFLNPIETLIANIKLLSKSTARDDITWPNSLSSELKSLLDNFKSLISTVNNKQAELLLLQTKSRKLADNAVSSESYINQILNNVEDGIVTADEQGIIKSVNKAIYGLFDYTADELIGKNIDIFVPETYKKAHSQGFHRYLQAGEKHLLGLRSVEVKAIKKGGEIFDIEIGVSELKTDEERVFIAIMHNISHRKHIEHRLIVEKQRMSRFFNASMEGLFFHDNGIIVDVNQTGLRMFGYRNDEVVEHSFFEFIPEQYQELAISMMAKHSTETWELEVIKKDGSLIPVEIQGQETIIDDKNIRIIAIRDISELHAYRTKMEQLVKKRTQELNAICTLSPDGFVLINPQGNIVYANDSFTQMTGLSFQGYGSMTIEDFYQQLFLLSDGSKKLDTNKRINGNLPSQTIHLIRPAKRVLRFTSRKMQDQDQDQNQKLQGTVLYFHDITHESELDEMKSEFLSTAAHELRTPLASILGFSELLLMHDYDEVQRVDLIDTIHRQSVNLKHLLDELLDLARIESRAGKDFTILSTTVESVLSLCCRDMRSLSGNCTLKKKISESWPKVLIDEDKILQVLTNVIGNAFKYSPAGGEVIISTAIRESEEKSQFGIIVEDHGIGMTLQQISRVGERFFRVDNTGSIPGTGLGMALVKEIIEIHGGTIEIESQIGLGTTVSLWLPIDNSVRGSNDE